jgi:hypothetical protein
MHLLETAIEIFGQFFLDLAGVVLDPERTRPRTVIGWIVLLLAVLAIAGMSFLIVRGLLFSK